MTEAPEPWLASPAALLDRIWQMLGRGTKDRRSAARHPVLATAGVDGGAEARVLVLRGADCAAATLEVHSDARAGKLEELSADPRATLLVWDARARLQIRMKVAVEAARGDGDGDGGGHASRTWAELSDGARQAYGAEPPPGTPVAAPAEVAVRPRPERFAVLTCRVTEIDALHLGPDRHRRARFRRGDGWQGTWIAP